MKMKTLLQLAALAPLALSGAVLAAPATGTPPSYNADGSASDLSTGSADADSTITMNIPPMIQISQVDDMDFTYDPADGTSGLMSENQDFCVYRNKTGGAYSIEFNGDDGTPGKVDGGEFLVSDGSDASNNIDYTVRFHDGSGSYVDVTSGNVISANGDSDSFLCATRKANLEVSFDKATLAASKEAAYSGDLYITVAPQ
jgi:hypothetical protein